MPIHRTPGVYVEEISKFPPSVAQVETAIPAFIGYTEKAEKNGEDLFPDFNNNKLPKAIKIKSLLEFEEIFGISPNPKNLQVTLDQNNNPQKVIIENAFFLCDSLRMYFDNGGGDCYIVSVGNYDENVNAEHLKKGVDALRKEDEPTLLLSPDAVLLENHAEIGAVQGHILQQCNTLKDRFGIFDVKNVGSNVDIEEEALNFRDNIGVNYLKYGAVYYPPIRTTIPITFKYSDITLFKDGNEITLASILSNTTDAENLDNALISKSVIRENLKNANQGGNSDQTYVEWFDSFSTFNKEQLAERGEVIKKIALDLLDLSTGGNNPLISSHLRAKLDEIIDVGNSVNNILQTLINYDYGYGEILSVTMTIIGIDNTNKIFTVNGNLGFLNAGDIITVSDSTPIDNNGNYTVVTATYNGNNDETTIEINPAPLNETVSGNISENFTRLDILNNITEFNGTHPFNNAPDYELSDSSSNTTIYGTGISESDFAQNAEQHFRALLLKLLAIIENLYEEAEVIINDLEFVLNSNGIYSNIKNAIRRENIVLPPSGIIAGIYAAVDNNRGVWKAPANVSLASVVGPVVKISHEDQESLNIHTTGKSINAIRSFTGKGTLVWGARTLDGNSNEWRYIHVRRLFIMVEESIKKASQRFVFEPNDLNTWITVRTMIENFLVGLWQQGALAGAKPEEAFRVAVGLNQTMTAQDILEGRMIIEIGMAAVRPAEFIILKFSHKMQES